MNLSTSLLYLLLLYAVLDKDGKLSLNTGLLIAFGIMLLNCYFGRCCGSSNNNNVTTGNSVFGTLNGF